MFVLPSWATHEHVNEAPDERAILFSAQDTPLLTLADMYQVEAHLDAHQTQTSTFVAARGAA